MQKGDYHAMRVVTNEALINRNKKLAQGLFIASLVLLGGGFLLANRISQTQYAVYFQCVMIPVMFAIVIISVRLTNKWVRPPHPWEAIPAGLKGVSNETILYNFLMPADHVLVADSGVFVIETRFQDRPQKITDDKWHNTGGLLAFMRQEQIGNPTQDAISSAEKVQDFIQNMTGDSDIEVQPLVLFVSPRATVEQEGEQSVPVLFAEGDKKRGKVTLKDYLRDAKDIEFPTLSPEQIAKLDDKLLYVK